MSSTSSTRLFHFPSAATETTTQLTSRIQNILQSPVLARYEVLYKVYRRQADKLATLQFAGEPELFCLCESGLYELGAEYENLLLKLKTWTLRQTTKISGSVHQIEQYGVLSACTRRVSVGMISQGPSSKGLVLEVKTPQEFALQSALETDDQLLQDVMGPIYQNLYIGLRTEAPMVISTDVTSAAGAKIQSEKMQTATSYFELFTKMR